MPIVSCPWFCCCRANSARLADAEEVTRRICGFSEIDYERAKAHTEQRTPATASPSTAAARVESYEREVRARGIDYLTFRRLAEACDTTIAEIDALRAGRKAGNDASSLLGAIREAK